MWIGAGALPMSCAPPWGRQSPEVGDVGCCRKGLHGYCICSHLPYFISWRGRTDHTDTWGVLFFRARGSCSFRGRIRPCTGQISGNTTGICLFTVESNPCRLGEGYTSQVTTRSPLSGITAGRYFPWLCGWGGALQVPIPGDIPDIVTTVPVWTLWTIWLPSKDLRMWVNTMLFLSLISDSTVPWPQKNEWKCIVVHPEWNRTSSPVIL